MNDIEDIYAAIGYGGITTGQVLHKLIEQYRKEEKANQLAAKLEQKEEQRVQNAVSHHGVVVKGRLPEHDGSDAGQRTAYRR